MLCPLRPWLTLAALLLLLGSGAAQCAGTGQHPLSGKEKAQPLRPNIVVILADDLGYGDLGCTGSREVPSPEINRLAAQGCFFERAYAAAPMCAPSRMALMTGRQPKRYGITVNPNWKHPALPESQYGLPVSEKILPQYLNPLGYNCAAMGKWHLGHNPGQRPEQRGFSAWWGFLGGSRHYVPMPNEQKGLNPSRIVSTYDAQPRVQYLTDDITRESVRFIGSSPEPFFLYVAYNAPHWPLESLPGDRDAVLQHARTPLDAERLHYAALIHSLDRGVGQITKALRERGVDERTWIFFASDNGGVPEPYSSNAPWRGHKRLHYEGGVRVPLIVRPAAGWRGAARCAATVSLMDILPTVLDLNGALPEGEAMRAPGNVPLDGRSMIPVLRGESVDRGRILHWCTDGTAATMQGDWKLLLADGQAACLYHLRTDPQEQRNCLTSEPEQAERLQDILQGYLASTPAPRYPENPSWSRKLLREHARAAAQTTARAGSPPPDAACRAEPAATGDFPSKSPPKDSLAPKPSLAPETPHAPEVSQVSEHAFLMACRPPASEPCST